MHNLSSVVAGIGEDGDDEIELGDGLRVALDEYIMSRASLYEEGVSPLPNK